MSSVASTSISRLVCPVSSVVNKSSTVVRSCPHLLERSQEQDKSFAVSPSQLTSSSNNVVKTSSAKDFSRIPSAFHLPVLGTIPQLIASGGAPFLHKYCDQRHKSLGPLFREMIGDKEVVFVADAQLMKKVYSNEGQYPVHSVPEPWTLFNHMKGIQRGLFFM